MNQDLNYKQAYYHLFNTVTDIINLLKHLQQQSEDIIIGNPPDVTFHPTPESIIKGMANTILNQD